MLSSVQSARSQRDLCIYYLCFLISDTLPLFRNATISDTKLEMAKKVLFVTNMPLKSKRGPLLFYFTPWIILLCCGPRFCSLDSLVFPAFSMFHLLRNWGSIREHENSDETAHNRAICLIVHSLCTGWGSIAWVQSLDSQCWTIRISFLFLKLVINSVEMSLIYTSNIFCTCTTWILHFHSAELVTHICFCCRSCRWSLRLLLGSQCLSWLP